MISKIVSLIQLLFRLISQQPNSGSNWQNKTLRLHLDPALLSMTISATSTKQLIKRSVNYQIIKGLFKLNLKFERCVRRYTLLDRNSAAQKKSFYRFL